MDTGSAFLNLAKNILIGGSAACCTGIFTNPLDVVKIRMQLQGELKARGQHTVHYRYMIQFVSCGDVITG